MQVVLVGDGKVECGMWHLGNKIQFFMDKV